ncbi:MAG: hypothetical protein KDD64_10095 [Bdellovibrionales bacterium]|nr:hypothetical protein [Bdellovibrionales bacterium]
MMDLYLLSCIAIGLSLLWAFALSPTVLYLKGKDQREFEREYRFFMTQSVKKYYPAAEPLTPREIEENFNVTASFNRLGKRGYPLSRKPSKYLTPLSPGYVPRNAFTFDYID